MPTTIPDPSKDHYVILSATFLAEKVELDKEDDRELDDDEGDDTDEYRSPIDTSNGWRWLFSDEADKVGLDVEGSLSELDVTDDEYGLGHKVYELQQTLIVAADKWLAFQEAYDYLPKNSEPNMGMITEFGHLPGYRWNNDGMDWNVSGWTPVLEVSISATPTQEQFNQNPGHFGYDLSEIIAELT